MTFSIDWEQRYQEQTHLSVWPWSDVVSYVMRYARPNSADWRVLELGCGAGANIPFFKQLGARYYSVEGSPFIVEQLHRSYPDLASRILTGDFTRSIPFNGPFDLVVDRSSLTHNSTRTIQRCLNLVYSKLKSGGKYIGIDWFSTRCSEFTEGENEEDSHTRGHYRDGRFAGVGPVHFSDKEHLVGLFKRFRIDRLEHKIINREVPKDARIFAVWNLLAERP